MNNSAEVKNAAPSRRWGHALRGVLTALMTLTTLLIPGVASAHADVVDGTCVATVTLNFDPPAKQPLPLTPAPHATSTGSGTITTCVVSDGGATSGTFTYSLEGNLLPRRRSEALSEIIGRGFSCLSDYAPGTAGPSSRPPPRLRSARSVRRLLPTAGSDRTASWAKGLSTTQRTIGSEFACLPRCGT